MVYRPKYLADCSSYTGVYNTTADSESRSTKTHTEWMIDSSILQGVSTQFGFQPNIDIFSSHLDACRLLLMFRLLIVELNASNLGNKMYTLYETRYYIARENAAH